VGIEGSKRIAGILRRHVPCYRNAALLSLEPDRRLSTGRVTFMGLSAGVLNGLIGIGGGIVIVPGLVVHRGASPEVAVGTSLAAVVVLSSIAFMLHASFTGLGLDPWGLTVVIAGGILGAQVGAWMLARLTARWLLLLFSVFVLIMSTRLLAQGLGIGVVQTAWSGAPPPWSYPVIGLASGVLSGLFGVGGGALVLLGFAVLFGMPVQQGLPVALAVNVTNALAGCARHGFAGRVLWREVARMVPAAIGGIAIGTAVAVWLPASGLRSVFGAFFLFMAFKIGRQALRGPRNHR
jgi:uncharacterized membrane protein YfcA